MERGITMKKFKKVFTVLTASAMISCAFMQNTSCFNRNSVQLTALAVSNGEKAGSSIQWDFNTSNNTLYITGKGRMNNFSSGKPLPWEEYKYQIQNVVISEGVSSIGDYAFSSFTALMNVSLPESVKFIGKNSFSFCTALSGIFIPDGVVSIGDSAFENCSALGVVRLPSSLTAIAPSTFKQCSALREITVPDGVKSIGQNAFENCVAMTAVDIADSVSSIGTACFNNCSAISSIKIPSSLTVIGERVFNNCRGLVNVDIPESVTAIKRSAFSDCPSIISIEIPMNVSTIGDNAFNGMRDIKAFDVDENNSCFTSEDGVLFDGEMKVLKQYPVGNGAERYTIPDGVTEIAEMSFKGAVSLKEIIIPDTVTSIDKNAFDGCKNLERIVLPESVSSIGINCMRDCDSLRELVVRNPQLNIQGAMFPVECSIYGDRNSEAIKFAEDYGRDCGSVQIWDRLHSDIGSQETTSPPEMTNLPEETTIPDDSVKGISGDVNSDGSVSIADAVAILSFIANPDNCSLSEEALKRADVYNYGDGVTSMDALTIQQVEAQIISADSLPIRQAINEDDDIPRFAVI